VRVVRRGRVDGDRRLQHDHSFRHSDLAHLHFLSLGRPMVRDGRCRDERRRCRCAHRRARRRRRHASATTPLNDTTSSAASHLCRDRGLRPDNVNTRHTQSNDSSTSNLSAHLSHCHHSRWRQPTASATCIAATSSRTWRGVRQRVPTRAECALSSQRAQRVRAPLRCQVMLALNLTISTLCVLAATSTNLPILMTMSPKAEPTNQLTIVSYHQTKQSRHSR
jgi:hypothetical protein